MDQRAVVAGRRLVSVAVLVAAAAAACTREKSIVRLGVVSGLGGTTAPCGCTSEPKGGLDRLSTLVQGQRRRGQFELVLAGDTFFAPEETAAVLTESGRDKAEAIAEIVAKWRPLAILPGPTDLATAGDRWLRSLGERHPLSLLQRPRPIDRAVRADSLLHTVGGLKIGIVGAPDAEGHAGQLNREAAALRSRGADIVIVLLDVGGEGAWRIATLLDNADIVVAGGSAGAMSPRLVGEALLVEATDKGQHLGVLALYPGERRDKEAAAPRRARWFYDDQGHSERAALTQRSQRLEREIQRLPDGAPRQARTQMRDEVQRALQHLEVPEPARPFVRWELLPVGADIEGAAWATQRLRAYYRSLCASARKATRDLRCAQPDDAREIYVGNHACRECHAEAFAVYEQTAHARAWKSLVDSGRECDLTCIGCHSIGYGEAGGYCRVDDAEAHANVGCESCHGPGGAHVAASAAGDAGGAGGGAESGGARFVRKPGVVVCEGCHTPQHSDRFDGTTYVPRILGPGHTGPGHTATGD